MSSRILVGDCRDLLATLPDESVHACVTSPPYFGLRDYNVAGQMGIESTPAEFIDGMVAVFREVRRVLRRDGTLWLNIGDAYANDTKWGGASGGKHVSALHGDSGIGRAKRTTGLKAKDLMMIPARLAIALQDDGWWLRSDIIWHKKAPMPEAVNDRPTQAHEHVFLLTKSARYFYDAESVKEPNSSPAQLAHNLKYAKSYDVYDSRAGATGQPGNVNNVGIHSRPGIEGRNLRNVWTLGPDPYPGAHFATFPKALAETCIKAGCPVGGVVLDPFAGSGTTGMVADRLGRDSILIELNPIYAEMARNRITNDAPMFAVVEVSHAAD